jgi:hypothetical protein
LDVENISLKGLSETDAIVALLDVRARWARHQISKQKVKVRYEQQLRKIRIRRNRLRGILHSNIRCAKGRSLRWSPWRQRTPGPVSS